MSTGRDIAEAAGQILIGGFDGSSVPDDAARMVTDESLGGIILFTRNIEATDQLVELVRALRALPSDAPLWLSIDQEGGRVQRLRAPFPELPPMRALGDREDDSVELAARVLARGLRALGFNQDYAPVLDVDTNPANPVIGDRSFSRDPETVARLGARFIRAMQAEGVAACGKHFPGHGDTSTDSHFELPRLDHALERLEAVELVPFAAAVEADVASIMTAHVLFPALDPDHPATLSEHVIRPLLRDKLGYEGVIVSDDLEMKAVADNYGIEEAVVRAVRVGCDQLLICHQMDLVARAKEALIDAVATGRLERDRLLEAADRVKKMKARYVAPEPVKASELAAAWPTELHEALTRALA